jgi:hypothetical protein
LAKLQHLEQGIRRELQEKETEKQNKEEQHQKRVAEQKLRAKQLSERKKQTEEHAEKQAIELAKTKKQKDEELQIKVIEDSITTIVSNIPKNTQFIDDLVNGNLETINKTNLQKLLKALPSENKSILDLDSKLRELHTLSFIHKYEKKRKSLDDYIAEFRNLSKTNLDKIYYLFCKYNKLLLEPQTIGLEPRTIGLSELGTFINSDRIFDINNYIQVKIYQDAISKINEHALYMLSYIQDYIGRTRIDSVYLYDSSNILYEKKPNKSNINNLLIEYIKNNQKSDFRNDNIFRLCVYHNYELDYNNVHVLESLSNIDTDPKKSRLGVCTYIITIPTRLYNDSIKTTYELDDVFILLLTHHLTKHNIRVTIYSNDGYSPKRYNNICVNNNDYIPCQSDVLSAIRFVIPDILTNIVSDDGSFKGTIMKDDLMNKAKSGGRESNKQTLFLNHCY